MANVFKSLENTDVLNDVTKQYFMKILLVLLLAPMLAFAQGATALDKAVASENWNAVSELVTRKINGTKLPDGKYNEVFESLITHFKTYTCVADAEWTKCGAKILIFPGQETIAIKFKTTNREVEKIFPLSTSYYRTHMRIFCVRIRIPTIERDEMVSSVMKDPTVESAIQQMRNTCARDIEQKKVMAHHAKVFFTAKIIGGVDERSFPPLNFNCTKRSVKIQFSATNNTEDTLSMYWPSNTFQSDPLFRISFYSHRPNLEMIEDTLAYLKDYRVVLLQPKETIKTLQYLYQKESDQLRNGKSITHKYDSEILDAFQNNTAKKGISRIGFSSVNNGLSWQEDAVWKPAEPVYIYHMTSYSLTDECK